VAAAGNGRPPPLPVGLGAAYPPVPELFCPSGLLGGFTLEVLGPVTVAGRDAIAVAATPRRDVLSSGPGHRSHDRISHDRIEVAVDAELGILLRRIETSGGELVTLTELTDLTMNPPEAADPARPAPPPRPSTARPAPSPPPGASWTTCAAIARQQHAALITAAAGARGRLRVCRQDIVHL